MLEATDYTKIRKSEMPPAACSNPESPSTLDMFDCDSVLAGRPRTWQNVVLLTTTYLLLLDGMQKMHQRIEKATSNIK